MRDASDRDQFSPATAPSFVLLLLLPLLMAGCGDDTPPVPEGSHIQRITGKVMLGNGMPLGQGKVVLTPRQGSGKPLIGGLDSDGTFTLMEDQGLTISRGEFLVHIEQLTLPTDIAKTPQAQAILAKLQKARQPIPAKYQKPETSNLKAAIGPDTREIPTIVLK